MSKRPEDILDEYLNLLRQEGNFEAIKNRLSRSRALAEQIFIADLAWHIPTNKPILNQTAIWNRVSQQIKTNRPQTQTATLNSPAARLLSGFTLYIPKTAFAIMMIVLMFWTINSTAIAASNSLPGQTLYPIKRTVEKIQLTIALDEVKKTEIRIKHAETRLEEAKTIIDTSSSTDEKIIEQTLNDLKSTTAQVADKSSNNTTLLQKVVELTDKQETVLPIIQDKVTGDAKKVVDEALSIAKETKNTAEKNLEELQNQNSQSNDTATTTPEALQHSSSTFPQIKQSDENSTSSGTTIRKLGSPDESSTIILLPPSSQNVDEESTSSAPEILELK